MKDIKIFLKKKKTKGNKGFEKYMKTLLKWKKKSVKNLSEEEKEKLADYRRIYHLTHKNNY